MPSPKPTYEDLLARVADLEQQQPPLLLDRGRLLALINSLPEDVFFVDADGQVVLVNAAARASLGISESDDVCRRLTEMESMFEVYTADGRRRPPAESPFVLALKGEVVIGEERVRHVKTGELRHRQYEVSPVHLGGRLVGAVSVVRDITDVKRAEQALQEAQSQTEWHAAEVVAIMDAAPTMIFVAHDVECQQMSGNRVAHELLGLSPTANLSKSAPPEQRPTTFRAMKDGKEIPPAQLPVQMAAHGEHVRDYEFDLVTSDGTVHSVLGDAVPLLDSDGQARGAVGAFIDITNRKRAEATALQSQTTFSELVERAPFGIYIVDSRFCIAHMNAASQAGAFRNVRPVIGRDFAEAMRILWPEAVAVGIIAAFRHTLETGEPFYSPRFVNPRHDVDIVEGYEWELHRMTLPDGQFGVICYYFDSTQLREAERRLQEEAQRKDDFIALLGHELRNPLAPISYAARLIRESGQNPALAERACSIVERQVSHLTRLVDDLLDVSRITRGRIELQTEEMDLVETVRGVIADCQPMAAEKRLSLEEDLVFEPMRMDADRARIIQVVSNLIHNAVKFTEAGGRVTVSVRADDESEWARVSVRDTGKGIPRELLASLFQPFVQGAEAIGRSHGGLGLGLALVKGLVELHGGTVSAQSDGAGLGSAFTVRLPMPTLVEVPGWRPGATPELARTLRPRRVLIVEDNGDLADTLQLVLQLSGHTVEVAHDGPTGLATACAFGPEIILCDIGLPGEFDGYALARKIRQTPHLKGVYLAAMTGFGRSEDRERTAQAGFDTHLTKPLDAAGVLELIDGRGSG